ncbi:DnaD domain protein [Lactobacillus sp. ESL0791]|uniref:DnaD domain protein n=1 Tax=Lactobacillus sp. ESL0791 TaxID=2983234 RepID=UPI0023F87A63|nr:DnaD domain protein [Lactobacillus sp. ESL0791]MDF7639181.1 DnaD domain protein [Lactobacillus sp. ESL0791]
MYSNSDPKQPFFIINKVALFPDDIKILIKLYQPLVGPVALSLYLTLNEDFSANAILSDATGLYHLQEQLDCSLPNLFKALHKLEAVGLIKTLLLNNEVMGQVITFELLKVPSAAEFFATALLSSLLKEKVGVSSFKNLSHEFASRSKEQKNLVNGLNSSRDVSASFIDVFRLPDQEAINPSAEVEQAAKENQVEQVKEAQVNDHAVVDWDLMKQQFLLYQIPEKQVELNKKQIQGLMQTYGLSEQEFVDETLPCLHGSYTLNMREISQSLAENYRLTGRRQQVKQELAAPSANKQDTSAFNGKEQKILRLAQTLSPAQFLYKMKKEKGGFVYASENQIINNLHNQYGLPADLVNILIYTCLGFNPALSANLAYSIANDWLQNGVKTADQALAYVTKRREGKNQKRKVYNNYHKRVEKGTDWSKTKAKNEENVSSEELKQFFKNLEDKNGMK